MELISYRDLSLLRLRDFVDQPHEITVEEGGMRTVIGLGGFEQLGETYFGWKQGEPYQTAEITLDLGRHSALSEEAAVRLLRKLRLPVRKGMPGDQLIEIFGQPQIDKRGRPGIRCLRFVCGEAEPYLLGFWVDEKEGLIHMFLARKNYWDEYEAL